MQHAISEIIDEIPNKMVFDSHFVISQLIKYHSNTYLTFASDINTSSDKTLAVHGKIGQEIAKFESTAISRIDNMSWSENIHGKPSKCTMWEKI